MERRILTQALLCVGLFSVVSLQSWDRWRKASAEVDFEAIGTFLPSRGRRLNEPFGAHDNSLSANISVAAGQGFATADLDSAAMVVEERRASATGGQGSGGSSHSGHEEDHKSPAFDPIVFLLTTLFCSMVSQQSVNIIPSAVRPPHSVVLYSLGMVLAVMARGAPDSEFGVAMLSIANIDAHVIFWVFLPMLLYEDAAGSDWHVVKRVLPSAIILAVPGVIINTVLTGLFIKLLGTLGFESALLLGSMLSATDPVAVVGALAALQAPAKLSSIISGESLLNDGSAVVLFQIFLEVASGRKAFDILGAIAKLVRLAGGGVVFGLAVAVAAHVWMAKTTNFSTEIFVIVTSVFGLFFVAEHHILEFSGVLAVVTFGFFMAALGKYDLAPEKEHEHHAIVNNLAFICNESIFIIAGVVGYGFSFTSPYIGARDWLDLCLLYIGVHATRAATMGVCFPILHRIGYGLSVSEAAICVFGGLRGAVGLALALIVLGDSHLSEPVRHKVCFHTNGIVLGTLFINGLLITPLYKFLKIQSPARAGHHHRLLKCLLAHGDEMVEKRVRLIETHWFFRTIQCDKIKEMVPSLSEELHHAEEDFYGRRRHLAMDGQRVQKCFEDVVLGLKGMDHVEAFKKNGEEKSQCDHVNLFDTKSIERHTRHLEWQREHHLTKQDLHNLKQQTMTQQQDTTPEASAEEIPADNAEASATPAASVTPGLCVGDLGIFPELPADDDSPVAQQAAPIGDSGSSPKKGSDLARQISPLTGAMHLLRDISGRLPHLSGSPKGSDVQDVKAAESYAKAPSSKKFHFLAHRQLIGVSQEEANGLHLELQQSLVNTQRSNYKQMYETQVISQPAYDFLQNALHHQVEAINGDLKYYRFLQDELPDLHKADSVTQMKGGGNVAFVYIKTHLRRMEGISMNLVRRLSNRPSRLLTWYLIDRNVKVLLAYILTMSQNIEELEHMKKDVFQGRDDHALALHVTDELLGEMRLMLASARDEVMFGLMQEYPVMFKLYEHVLFAQLMVVQQISVLRELAEEGGIGNEDLESFLINMTDPTFKVITRYTPSLEQLVKAGAPGTDKYSRVLDAVVYMVNQVSLQPVWK